MANSAHTNMGHPHIKVRSTVLSRESLPMPLPDDVACLVCPDMGMSSFHVIIFVCLSLTSLIRVVTFVALCSLAWIDRNYSAARKMRNRGRAFRNSAKSGSSLSALSVRTMASSAVHFRDVGIRQ